MVKPKLKLTKDLVKNIFPGLHYKVAPREEGLMVYDFNRELPRKLRILIPSEVKPSNYNRVFPLPFDGCFKNLEEFTARFSRLLETPIKLSVPSEGVEAMAGGLFVYENRYQVFRFDEFLEATEKKYLLCRAKAKKLSINETVDIVNMNPVFLEETVGLDGAEYIYWLIPIVSIFSEPEKVLLATFAYAGLL